MSTRIRDENLLHHSRKPLGGLNRKGPANENALTPGRPSLQRQTLASSLKAKPELKSKSSRPVLVALAKPNPNATPRPGTGAAEIKPKPKTLPLPLADKTLAGKQQPKISSSIQTPGPKRAAPKSAKKAISVYTPAPKAKAPTNDDTEVEFSHPRPPGALDDLVFGGEDFNPRLEELDLEEYPDIPEPSGMPQPLFELSTGNVDTPPRPRLDRSNDINFISDPYASDINEHDDLPIQ